MVKEKKTYFVSSDIHSYYDEYLFSLSQKGFDINNPNHVLIICGDLFDRGPKSRELLDFLFNLPEDRRILIRGNHEDLLLDIFNDGYIKSYDVSNGTVNTITNICQCDKSFVFSNLKACYEILEMEGLFELIDSMKNYYEIGDYIFVHGWIPTKHELSPTMHLVHRPNKDWRNADPEDWEDSRWTNGMQAFYSNCGEKGKTIVCGHWHTSYGHARRQHRKLSDKEYSKLEFGEDACFDIFEHTRYNKSIIALDACTAHTGKVNVFKFEN